MTREVNKPAWWWDEYSDKMLPKSDGCSLISFDHELLDDFIEAGRLDNKDRRLIYAYMKGRVNSIRTAAKYVGMSHVAVHKRLKKIKPFVKELLSI